MRPDAPTLERLHRTAQRSTRAVGRIAVASPAASIYIFVVTITTLMLLSVDAQFADELLRQQSTNIVQMSRDAPRVLVLSAFFLASRRPNLSVVVAAVVLVVAERRLRTRAWLVTAVAGHVGASMATTIAIWLQVRWGELDPAVVYPVDVGISYVVAAQGGALCATLTGRRRGVAVAATVAAFAAVAAHHRTFTDAGHLVACVIGVFIGLGRRHGGAEGRGGSKRWIAQPHNKMLVAAAVSGIAALAFAAMVIDAPSTRKVAQSTTLTHATILRLDSNGDAELAFVVDGRTIDATVPAADTIRIRGLRVGQRRTISYVRSDPQLVTLGRALVPDVTARSFFLLAAGSTAAASLALLAVWFVRYRPPRATTASMPTAAR